MKKISSILFLTSTLYLGTASILPAIAVEGIEGRISEKSLPAASVTAFQGTNDYVSLADQLIKQSASDDKIDKLNSFILNSLQVPKNKDMLGVGYDDAGKANLTNLLAAAEKVDPKADLSHKDLSRNQARLEYAMDAVELAKNENNFKEIHQEGKKLSTAAFRNVGKKDGKLEGKNKENLIKNVVRFAQSAHENQADLILDTFLGDLEGEYDHANNVHQSRMSMTLLALYSIGHKTKDTLKQHFNHDKSKFKINLAKVKIGDEEEKELNFDELLDAILPTLEKRNSLAEKALGKAPEDSKIEKGIVNPDKAAAKIEQPKEEPEAPAEPKKKKFNSDALGAAAKPLEKEPKVEPAKEEPKVEPAKEEPKVEPAKEEPKVEPAKEEPKVEPAKEEPKVEPAKEEPKVEPAKEEPKVEPAKEEPKVEPAKEEPKVEPAKEEPKVEPAKEEPKVEPAKEEPKVEAPEQTEAEVKNETANA